jgi:DNA polymerase-3 subunit gamma/tau
MEVLYRKWRPQTLADVVGQDHVTHTLLNALKTGRVAHAYLFCGPRGTGKTSSGRILAKAVNCTEGGDGEPCNQCTLCQEITGGRAMDVMEIDAASNRGIDEIRELRERVRFSPASARYKVYIIDEVHMLTEPAANALLKTLEEPPPQVMFVLATTEAHKVPLTILSRCQRFDFRRIPLDATVSRLSTIAGGEGIKIDDASLRLIARSATGSMRDAINLLEQLSAQYGNEISLNQVRAILGITEDVRARELVKHIVIGDIPAGLHTINSVNQDGIDLRQFNRELVEYLRGLLLIKAGADEATELPAEALPEMRELAERASMPQISNAVRLFRTVEMEFDGFSPLPLELALVECALPSDRSATLEKLERATEPPQERQAATAQPSPTMERKPVTPAQPAKAEPKADDKVEKTAGRAQPTGIEPTAKVKDEKEVPAEAEETATEKVAEPDSLPEPAEAEAPVDEKVEEDISPAPAAAAASSEMEGIRGRWKEVVAAAKGMGSRGNLDALLRSACEPIDVKGDTIVLGFYYDFHKEKIEDPKYRTMVEAKVLEIFGKPYKIRCQIIKRESRQRGHVVDAALKMGATIIEDEEEIPHE